MNSKAENQTSGKDVVNKENDKVKAVQPSANVSDFYVTPINGNDFVVHSKDKI